jgi:hypothetical protein
LPAVESLRKRHVISLDFDMARSRIVTMCDNRSVEIRDYDSLALQHSFSPNSALTEARFGPEPGTIRVGMWNLSDAETNRLYLRELWLPDSSEHGHAEMWDYHSGSRISSVFAFRGFGDRAGYLHSNFGVLGLDSQRRVRFGRWPTRNAYSQDQLIAAGKQFLQRDFASADPRQQLSPRQIVDAWQRISMASAAAQTAPGALPQPALSQPALPQPAPPQPALSQPAPGTVPGMLQSLE